MVEQVAFAYRPGNSTLHRLDARMKTLALIAVSLTLMATGFWGLAHFGAVLALGLRQARLPLMTVVAQLRYFLVLLGFVFLTRAVATPGEPLVDIAVLTVTRQGLVDGALMCWRLLSIVICGLIYSATTKPKQVRVAVAALLKPLPGQAAPKVATLMALMVRFVPEVLHQMRRTQVALRSRGIENRKNPLRRLKCFSIAVLRNTIITADRLALALAARCFDPAAVPAVQPIRPGDWLFLALAVTVCAVALGVRFLSGVP